MIRYIFPCYMIAYLSLYTDIHGGLALYLGAPTASSHIRIELSTN